MIKEFQKENRWLSNFATCFVTFEGMDFPSTEHAYQAAKTLDFEERKSLLTMSAGEAKKAAKKFKIREDWESIKLSVMEDLLRQKFNKSPFKEQLLETKNEFIQEGNWWNDTFWGVCLKTNKGQNNLGKLIMKIRNEIRENNKQ